MGRKFLIGCGALSVLAVLGVVFIVIIVSLSGGGGETAGGEGGGQGSGGSGSGGEAEQPTAGVGEKLTVGDAEWIINNAVQTDELQSQFGGPAAQGNFIVVDFTFTNNTGEAVTLDPSTMTLIDGQGRESEADTDAFEYIPEGRDLFLEQVNPGVTQEGQVIFTVAPDAADFELQVGGAGFFSTDTGLIDMGF